MVFGTIEIEVPATAAARLIDDAPEVIETVPAEALIAAPVFVIAPDPAMVISPVAPIAPVGATEVPPEIERVPPCAVIAPAPV